MKTNNSRKGSIFLLAVGAMVVLFIVAYSLTFFTGSEDFSSSLTYESEVAFNLAESAVDEFVTRLKYALNNDDETNQLFKILRSGNPSMKENQEVPLEASQVARLTGFTRETARQLYGIKLGQGNFNSKEFTVEATIKLNHLRPIEAKMGNKVLYTHLKDPKEKQGELTVTSLVAYRGRRARVTLVFLLRVVKSFVPPFNYFTLFVKNGTPEASSLNVWTSNVGKQDGVLNGAPMCNLTLDHGWTSIKPDFDAVKDHVYWENALSSLGIHTSQVPPGRVYIGQNPDAQYQFPIMIQSTNGTKLLLSEDNYSDGPNKISHVNAQENLFMKFDVDFVGMKDYVKKIMAQQGQQKDDSGVFGLFTGWSNDKKICIRNVGAGKELTDTFWESVPAFSNALESLIRFRGVQAKALADLPERVVKGMYPDADKSGLDLFGNAQIQGNPSRRGGGLDTSALSPTIVYGPVQRAYFRISTIKLEDGNEYVLPFVGTDPAHKPATIPLPPDISRDKKLTASQAALVFDIAGVGKTYRDKLIGVWDKLPDNLKELSKYERFMSDWGAEPYNAGLGNFLTRMKDEKDLYKGPLEKHLLPFMENEKYARVLPGLDTVIDNSPVKGFYIGDLYYSLPDDMESYLLDFYFIPRSTEDFFRGRTTISVSGSTFDRFDFKYVNDVKAYLAGAKNQTLELNGVLALNDPDPLVLRNLTFRGKGVIYSSPMMGGGPVVIAGDFFPASALSGSTAAFGSNSNNDMMTIVAPEIMIDTTQTTSDPCYVEANLISTKKPVVVRGTKKVKIKGSVVCPYLDLKTSFPNGGSIVYNPLNTIWRNKLPKLMEEMYVAKVVTGGVGKFEWQYKSE
ncbi:MAG: hypothetical protein HQM10_16025 [Candidatus Riflebacteria bacterium]|nr:hypothetical protein [Candidatus Riflebacteria bacterium]